MSKLMFFQQKNSDGSGGRFAAQKTLFAAVIFLLLIIGAALPASAIHFRNQAYQSWEKGWQAWQQGDKSSALAFWSKHAFAADLAPRPARLYYWRIRALEDLGYYSEAEKLRAKLADKFPTDFYTFLLFPDGGLATSPDKIFLKKITKFFHPCPWREEVIKASAVTGVSEGTIWSLMRRESKFRPHAVSQSGAVGLMQLMPSTAMEEASFLKIKKSDIYLPCDNILLGASHFSRMNRKFRSETVKSVAAYNAGASAVAGWGDLSACDWAEWVENIPYKETREFVRSVLENREVYRILYGFNENSATLFSLTSQPFIPDMTETPALRAKLKIKNNAKDELNNGRQP